MYESTLLYPSSETDNKLRWINKIDGVGFEFYIPKWRVPKPWPAQIKVTVENSPFPVQPEQKRPEDLSQPIRAVVKKVTEHTQTVRYRPIGSNPKNWEIGEPYIPFEILNAISPDYPDILAIEVKWDYSEGSWDED